MLYHKLKHLCIQIGMPLNEIPDNLQCLQAYMIHYFEGTVYTYITANHINNCYDCY